MSEATKRRHPLYDHRWARARKQFLAEHPLCRMCEQQRRTEGATVVDHIKPHKGDLDLFWDRSNWQPLCKTHHDATKQREERTGRVQGCDANGNPIDPGAHWR